MFGRAVGCVASICAFWSLLIAGEAGALPGRNHRTGSQYAGYNHGVLSSRVQRQRPAWPPRLPVRQRPVASHKGAARAGRLGDAFMVDTGVTAGPASGSQFSYGVASNGDGWRVMWSREGQPIFVDPRGGTHYDGRWKAPELPADPVGALVHENLRRGVEPDWRTAGARWKREDDIPRDVYFRALEATG